MKRLKCALSALALGAAMFAAACGQEAPVGSAPAPSAPETSAGPVGTPPSPPVEESAPPTDTATGDEGAEALSDIQQPQIVAEAPAAAAPAEPVPEVMERDAVARESQPRTRGLARSSDPQAAPSGPNGGGMARVKTAVIVEILPTDLRRARNGGSAVALLSARSNDLERNLRLCRALFQQIDAATVSEVIAGERQVGGVIQELRPLYWMLARTMPTASGDRCSERIARYDFKRATALRDKYGLTGRGPYLAIANTAETRVAVVDFGAAPIGETEALVRYFREGFSQDGDIWTEQRHEPATAEAKIAAFLQRSVVGASLTALLKPVARATCPLGDLLDACPGATTQGGR
jgi:hypothetical protein